MDPSKTYIASLLLKKLSGTLSENESIELENWRNSSEAAREKYKELTNLTVLRQKNKLYNELLRKEAEDENLPKIEAIIGVKAKARLTVMRKWRWAAASIVLILGTVAYLLFNNNKSGNTGSLPQTTANIAPGTNKATLRIGNDKPIDLSSNKTSISIGSAITYNDGERIADAGQTLQLVTPRGGQYQAILPDGTKVWLNAASSISLSSMFNKGKRTVEITGEVYMEVAQKPDQPFLVNTREAEIQVLGTSFNINAYPDEKSQRTTLVSGSVKVMMTGPGDRHNKNAESVILKPGQQAVIMSSGTEVVNADIDKVMAWKNGLFDFNGLSFEEIMRQLERWYDIEIVYENDKVPHMRLAGKMTRGVSLNGLLKQLGEMGVNYKLDKKTLIVFADKS